MVIVAGIVILTAAICFLGVACTIYAKPSAAKAFFDRFASSAGTHYLEQSLRLVFGIALIIRAPLMWQPVAFAVLGWVIALTAVVLCCAPWRWHHRFALAVMPKVYRYLKLFGCGVAAFGLFLLFGLLFGPEQ